MLVYGLVLAFTLLTALLTLIIHDIYSRLVMLKIEQDAQALRNAKFMVRDDRRFDLTAGKDWALYAPVDDKTPTYAVGGPVSPVDPFRKHRES